MSIRWELVLRIRIFQDGTEIARLWCRWSELRIQALLGVAGEAHEWQADHKVKSRDQQTRAEIIKCLCGDLFVSACEIDQRDHGHERGILEKRDEVIRHWRQDQSEGLRDYDMEEALTLRHAECAGGLHLASRNGKQAGSVIFGLIGSIV